MRDGGDRRAALGEEHQPRAVVTRVRAALHIAGALKLIDRLGHRLLAHPGQFGEPRDRDAVRRHEREHVRSPRADVAEPRLAQYGIDVLRVVLVGDLEGSRNVEATSAHELLARLEAEGLISGDAHVDLTAEGEALHRSLREYVGGPTAGLLSQFDIHDIETTVRTVQAITRRAAEEAAASAD